MSLADEIQRSHVRIGAPSKLEAILAALPKRDAEDLREALADRTVSSGAIYRALRARGIEVVRSTVDKWTATART